MVSTGIPVTVADSNAVRVIRGGALKRREKRCCRSAWLIEHEDSFGKRWRGRYSSSDSVFVHVSGAVVIAVRARDHRPDARAGHRSHPDCLGIPAASGRHRLHTPRRLSTRQAPDIVPGLPTRIRAPEQQRCPLPRRLLRRRPRLARYLQLRSHTNRKLHLRGCFVLFQGCFAPFRNRLGDSPCGTPVTSADEEIR